MHIASTTGEGRRFLEIRPVLDYTALTPGQAATGAIHRAAADLNFGPRYGAKLRLTGPVPIADEEYATLQEGAFVNTIVTIIVVLTILWLALRSWHIILAVFVSLIVGLSTTAALGLALQGDVKGDQAAEHRRRFGVQPGRFLPGPWRNQCE